MHKDHLPFICLAVILIITTSCGGLHHGGKDKKMPGTWQALPIVIDGKSDDWPSPYPSYDSKSLVGYATSNDKDYLYITLETGDEYVQTKILKQGLTVWIDTSGKKEQMMGIHFPLQDNDDPLELSSGKEKGSRSGGEGQGLSHDMTQKVKRALSDATQLTLEGFRGCKGGFLVKENNPCGIKVQIGIDEYKELIWEAAIPFSAIYNTDHINKKWDGRPISVGFFVKGFKKPSTSNGASDAGSMGSGGGRGMGSGGMGGGGGRGGSRGGGSRSIGTTSPRDQLFESTHTWKQFGISYQ